MSEEFIKLAGSLDILRSKSILFESRYKTPWFLAAHGDVVLSHQWHNDLNFLYLDVLHARYPLVHNSPAFKDCGYYYEGTDVQAGADALARAIAEHDSNTVAYHARADRCIYKYSVDNPRNVAALERLMLGVVGRTAPLQVRPQSSPTGRDEL